MNNLAGVQDVFCGKETIVHIKRGMAGPDPEAIEQALAGLAVVCNGVRRDDSAILQ